MESNSDSEEKKTSEAMKEKAKGKRPVDSETKANVELLTQKTKGISIDDTKVLKSDIDIESAAKSKGKEAVAGWGSKRSRGKQVGNVVKSCYSLRSGPKGMEIDVKPTVEVAGQKRKGQDINRFVLGTPGTCKTIGKRSRHGDDDTGDKDGSGGRVTRSSKKMKVNSV